MITEKRFDHIVSLWRKRVYRLENQKEDALHEQDFEQAKKLGAQIHSIKACLHDLIRDTGVTMDNVFGPSSPYNKINQYESFKEFTIEEIRAVFPNYVDIGEMRLRTSGLRVRCYLEKGVHCVECGLEGNVFSAERHAHQRTNNLHLNLYHISDNKSILMTIDHIVPRAKGGPHCLDNLQTMCTRCNCKKADTMPEEIPEEVMGRLS